MLVVVVVVNGVVVRVEVFGFSMHVQIAPTKAEVCERTLFHFAAVGSAPRLAKGTVVVDVTVTDLSVTNLHQLLPDLLVTIDVEVLDERLVVVATVEVTVAVPVVIVVVRTIDVDVDVGAATVVVCAGTGNFEEQYVNTQHDIGLKVALKL